MRNEGGSVGWREARLWKWRAHGGRARGWAPGDKREREALRG